MALLQHPNIVQIHEIGQQGEHPFLVMEYVEGQNLSASLAGKPLPPRKAAELVAVLARAVHAAHEQGIIHRDLKPNNILLAADGTPKICDFGLARHFEQRGRPHPDRPDRGHAELHGPRASLGGGRARKVRQSMSTPWGPCSTSASPGGPPSWPTIRSIRCNSSSSSSRFRPGNGSPRRLATWRRSA